MLRSVCRSVPRRSLLRLPLRSSLRSYASKNPFSVKNPLANQLEDPNKPVNMINNDYKMKNYTREVFSNMTKFLGTTTVSSAGTLGLGSLLVNNFPPTESLLVAAGMLWLTSMGGSLYCAYKLDTESKNPTKRTEYAYMMHGLMGVTLTPSLIMFPQYIPHALVISSALVAAPVSLALFTPKDRFLSWGVPLMTGLWGLIGVGFSSIGLHLLGFTEMAMSLHTVDLYGGVALFTAYSAYDTHRLISDFEEGKKDAVGHACQYSLNFINLFIRLLEILARNNGNRK